jgi:hypothetical protein
MGKNVRSCAWFGAVTRADAACVIGKREGTVNDTIARAIAAVLCWPIVLNDEALEKLLYFPPQPRSSRKLHQLDWQGLE